MLSIILADFSGYGQALGILYVGYLLLLLVATLVLLQFLRSLHALINRTTQNDKPNFVPTIFWGIATTVIVLLPSFLFEFGSSSHFAHPQNFFRISLGVVAIAWSRRLIRNGVTRLEGMVALSWGILVLVLELFTAVRLIFMSRVIQSDLREVFDFVFSLQRFLDTLTMVLFVLLSYIALKRAEHNKSAMDKPDPVSS
tara:strand:- start:2429 stop:3022 length:594 start_codon:yes stop_codon:yes gene_type:complete